MRIEKTSFHLLDQEEEGSRAGNFYKGHQMKKTIVILLAVLGILGLAGGLLWIRFNRVYNAPPEIKVSNQSARVLEDVLLEGTGFQENLGTLQPGETRRLFVYPRGESGLWISFRAGEVEIEEGDLAYMDSFGGYVVEIEITPALEVEADSHLMKLFGRSLP